MKKIALIALALVAAPLEARQGKVVDPLPAAVIGANHVTAVDVVVSDTAKPTFAKLEALATRKRVDAGLPAIDPAVPPAGARPARDAYSTLPFAEMFPLVVDDVTREWGLTSGRAVKLSVTIDSVKMANAAMAMLLGSADELAGMVVVSDATSGEKLGMFYVDVVNNHGGLIGLAARGVGVRESLSQEFALESSRILTGRKSKKPKA